MSTSTIPVRVVTLNIRYATKKPVPGEESWTVRCPKLCAQLAFIASSHSSVFICLQEVLHTQLTDIQARLGPSWAHIGRGRKDGEEAGEFSPIFFRIESWGCERNETYWLSKTPDVPSKGWDAALERIVTMGLFCRRKTQTAAIIMSTHLDHKGQTAREESAHLLVKLARNWTESWAGDLKPPLFLGGDFNSTPDGKAYKALTMPGSGMEDMSNLVPINLRYGNQEITYTSFGEPNEEPKRIDFLFVRGSNGLKFLTFGILPNRFDDMIYLSDHRPVVVDVEIPVGAANIS
ncbi:Endonuclease/exonuclease/phosphatase [Bombardia bombarda]|uniref:Endonuclease/exonuclease/phosphatase n=1 Tax=Bombardia bombarda TaxID=252184 RepID=A0AA40CFR9_9PEZI|nr:Endonuclease/exonuclease/phosphatase [Bombardia bombarda]